MTDHEGGRTLAKTLAGGGNALLAQMSEADLAFVGNTGSRRSFPCGAVMIPANTVAQQALFIERGIGSMVKPEPNDRRTEVCLIGSDSFVGAAIVQGDGRSPYEVFVQSDEIVAVCIDAAAFRELFERSTSFRGIVLDALHVQAVQIAENLICATWQPIQSRLARWLLMYQDRAATAYLEVTHEFMAIMIGAQRAKVTVALHELEAAGGISSTRGRVFLKDRAVLERLTDGTYGCAEQEAIRLRKAVTTP